MNPQLERLFHSVRRGIKENVHLAMKTLESSRRKDLDAVKKKIEQIKNSELVVLKKKLDDVKRGLQKVEALKPYLSAIETVARSASKKKAVARKPKRRTTKKNMTSRK